MASSQTRHVRFLLAPPFFFPPPPQLANPPTCCVFTKILASRPSFPPPPPHFFPSPDSCVRTPHTGQSPPLLRVHPPPPLPQLPTSCTQKSHPHFGPHFYGPPFTPASASSNSSQTRELFSSVNTPLLSFFSPLSTPPSSRS